MSPSAHLRALCVSKLATSALTAATASCKAAAPMPVNHSFNCDATATRSCRWAVCPCCGCVVVWLSAVVDVVCMRWMYGVHLVVYSPFLGVPSAMRVQTPLGVYTSGLGCCFVMFPMRAFSAAMFPILEVSDVLCVRWAIPTRRHQKVSVAMLITGPRSCRRTKLSSATWT